MDRDAKRQTVKPPMYLQSGGQSPIVSLCRHSKALHMMSSTFLSLEMAASSPVLISNLSDAALAHIDCKRTALRATYLTRAWDENNQTKGLSPKCPLLLYHLNSFF